MWFHQSSTHRFQPSESRPNKGLIFSADKAIIVDAAATKTDCRQMKIGVNQHGQFEQIILQKGIA